VPGHPFETFEDLALRGITFEPRDPPIPGVAVGVGYAYALWMYFIWHIWCRWFYTYLLPASLGGGAAPGVRHLAVALAGNAGAPS